METEIFIAKDAPVRLLNAIVERMNISKILRSYSRLGRIEYSPRILLKILLYAYVRGIYSSRKIEQACRENIHFMYLLEGHRVPDHNAICRFRSKHLAGQEDDLLAQMTALLRKWGFVSMEAVFIDGTKIEANANRYSFVWKKSTEKNRAKLLKKISEQLPSLLDKAEVKWRMPEAIEVRHLKKLEKKLKQKRKDKGKEEGEGQNYLAFTDFALVHPRLHVDCSRMVHITFATVPSARCALPIGAPSSLRLSKRDSLNL